MRTRLPKIKQTRKTKLVCVYGRTRSPSSDIYIFLLFYFFTFFSTRRGTYASSGSGLRSGARRGSSRLQSGGTGTGGGHSGHSANSGDSLADDDDDI